MVYGIYVCSVDSAFDLLSVSRPRQVLILAQCFNWLVARPNEKEKKTIERACGVFFSLDDLLRERERETFSAFET